MKRTLIVPTNLREVYHQPGEFSVKMLISSQDSSQIDRVDVSINNSDGRPMAFTHRRWGTKLNITFKIDDTTPDGVSVIDVTMSGRSLEATRHRFPFWVVK